MFRTSRDVAGLACAPFWSGCRPVRRGEAVCRILGIGLPTLPEARGAGRGSHLSKLKKCVRRIYTHDTPRSARALHTRTAHTHMHQTRRAHTRSRCDATCEISPTHAQARAQGTDRAETFRPLKPLRWKLSTTEGRGRLRIPRRLAPLPRTVPPLLCRNCNPLLLAALRPRLSPA